MGKKRASPVQPSQVTKVQASLAPSPISDETANWKTYSSTKIGIEIKYPENWAEPVDVSQPTVIFSGADPILGNIAVEIDKQTKVASLYDDVSKMEVGKTGYFVNTPQLRLPNITVSGYSSLIMTTTIAKELYFNAYIKKDNDYYLIQIAGDPAKRTEIEKLFIQILSTFKFTN